MNTTTHSTSDRPPERTPVFGTTADRLGALWAGLGATAVTAAYVIAVRRWSGGLEPTGLEAFGTATSLASVGLTRKQNIWSVIYGIVSVVAMGIFFFDIALVGQGWLHLGYYIPVQVIGWWAWLRGGVGRTDLLSDGSARTVGCSPSLQRWWPPSFWPPSSNASTARRLI